MSDSWRIIYTVRSHGTETRCETARKALRLFRSLVAQDAPASVWQWPASGGEMRCIATYPGLT